MHASFVFLLLYRETATRDVITKTHYHVTILWQLTAATLLAKPDVLSGTLLTLWHAQGDWFHCRRRCYSQNAVSFGSVTPLTKSALRVVMWFMMRIIWNNKHSKSGGIPSESLRELQFKAGIETATCFFNAEHINTSSGRFWWSSSNGTFPCVRMRREAATSDNSNQKAVSLVSLKQSHGAVHALELLMRCETHRIQQQKQHKGEWCLGEWFMQQQLFTCTCTQALLKVSRNTRCEHTKRVIDTWCS